MVRKELEKEKAIVLRKQGFSYREILAEISVAKSTLSLWLGDVGLSKKQKHRLTEKRIAGILKGAAVKRNQRINLVRKIYAEAQADIGCLTKRELWLMGIMLYWAEGSKEKEDHPGIGIQFTNSDAKMVRLFLKWLIEICDIKKEHIVLDIFLHENSKNTLEKVKKYWIRETGFSADHFLYVYFKKSHIKTRRKNKGDNYFGVIKIRVRASSTLNRKVAGWILGINNYYCRVV